MIWHYRDGNKHIPVPAVVIRQEPDGVIIRVRIHSTTKEVKVDPPI